VLQFDGGSNFVTPTILTFDNKGNKKMYDKRQVKFNVTIAKYLHGQIVNYADMPPGHQYWVDHEDILGSDRICEFVKEVDEDKEKADAELKAKIEAETRAKIKAENKVLAEAKADKERIAKEKRAELQEKIEAEAKLIIESEKTDADDDETETGNTTLDFNFEPKEDAVCPGINPDETPCIRTKLRENGYCWPHRFQAEKNSQEIE
jgi:hypothetical protein